MSIGNLRDEGNKGNNFPWQLKMLQGLSAISTGINNLIGALTPTPNPAVPVALTVVPEDIAEDAGFRSRVSQLTTLGDLKSINRYRTDLWLQNSTGSGTVAWANNRFTLGVTAKDESAIIQSKVSYPYFAGKSQLIECTFSNFEVIPGITKRVGYFDFFSSGVPDGVWLESGPNNTVTLIFRNALTGVEYQFPAENWTNPDFATHEWSQFNVVMFDFIWLGGLRLRLFASGPQGFTLAHEVNYAGLYGEGEMFIGYPSHPVTYQIIAPTGTGTTVTFNPICAQVATEGAIDNAGIVRSCSTRNTALTLTGAGTSFPVLAIRKAYANSPIKLTNFELSVATGSDRVYWEIQINPTLSVALTYNQIDSQSTTQFALGNGTITVTGTGRVIASGYLSTGQAVRTVDFEDNFLSLLGGTNPSTALSPTFTADQYVLVVTPLTSPVNVLASMQVKEL